MWTSGIGGDNLPHIDVDRTSGFTAVNRPVDGQYCLTPASGIDQQALPAAVSVDWSTTNEPEGNASALYHPGDGPNCLENQFKVVTQRQSIVGDALVSVPANDVGFTVIVP